MRNVLLKNIELPDFGSSEEMPEIPASEFEKRIADILAAMKQRQIDILLVFADREHFANFRYLTNLDPRFEESLLLLHSNGKRKLLFGNENLKGGGAPAIPFELELFQDFSLLAQPRSNSRTLEEILKEFGVTKNVTIGCAYYKYFGKNGNIDRTILELPTYIADTLRALTGSKESLINVNDLFMESSLGLRNHICLEELVRFEWASCRTSDSIRNMIRHIKQGIREYELARHYISDGLPSSCHAMLSTGEKAMAGLSSPGQNKVSRGDAFTSCLGLWGALTCRAAMVVEGAQDLNKDLAAFYEKFWKNYFLTVATWYESLGIGVTGGEVATQTDAARDKSLFDFALNTGHTLHLDEWVDSPFYTGSTIPLHSGLALQMDIIPVSKMPGVCANAEDGIALADENLRQEWSQRFPESWKRIEARRDFMINKLGIKIKPEVLPFSNIPAYFPPYLLSHNKVAVLE